MNLNTSEILRSPRFKINLKSKIQNLFVVKWFLLKIEIYRSAMRCSRLKIQKILFFLVKNTIVSEMHFAPILRSKLLTKNMVVGTRRMV